MSVIESLEIALSATTGKLTQGFKKAENMTKQFSSKASSFLAGPGGIGGAIAGAFAGVSVAAGVKYAIGQFSEIEQASTKLDNAIKASGQSAGVTTQQVVGFAQQMSTTTRFATSATTEAAAALAKFGQVKGPQFTETIKQAQNYATVMGKDLPGATAELGHALQNPSEGYLELAKNGVRFSEAQIDAIQSMQAAGDMAGAQKVVLEALNEQMGDVAEKAGDTLAGSFDVLHNTINNTAAAVGQGLAPSIKIAVGMMTDWLKQLDTAKIASGVFEWTAKAVGFVANMIQTMTIAWKAAQVGADYMLWGVVKAAAVVVKGLEDIINALGKLAGASKVSLGAKSLDEFAKGFDEVIKQDKAALSKAWNAPDASRGVEQFFSKIKTQAVESGKAMSDSASEMGKAIKDGPNQAMKQLTERQIEAQGEATKLIRDLKEQLKYYGQNQFEQQAGKLADKGASKGQIEQLKKLGAELQGKQLKESLENPLEKFQREMKKLDQLKVAGGIDSETYARAQTKLRKDFQSAVPEQKISAGGALSANSQEARSAILSYRQAQRSADPRLAAQRIAENQLVEQKQTNFFLRQMANNQPAIAQFAGL